MGADGQRSVLIVEDDPDIALLFVTTLGMHHITVHAVRDGAEALAALEAGLRPDAIVTDLHMPIMDGWELLAALHDHPVFASIPLLVLTAGDEPRREAPRPATILKKPVSTERLIEAIDAAIAHRT